MDAWVDIRRKARECHEHALAASNGDRRGAAIVAAALQKDDLEVRRMDFVPGLLGSLDRPSQLVNIAKGQKPEDELMVIAHEIGHFHLHRDPHNEVTARPQTLGGDPVDSGAGRVEGYSPRERKEVQADIFAGEFLCPSDWLRSEYMAGKKPGEIAAYLGLPESLVLNQMIRALLLPALTPASPGPVGSDGPLDESQAAAAAWDKGPLLVDAGPGTGKTRTLIRRIEHFLAKGDRPGSFLALTFSNKAAEEMRERLSQMNASAAIEMWVGTFHAFGLELIKKWPSSIGRTSDVRVLDQTGSLALLEVNLDKLPLRHYQNLYEPAYELVPLLQVISRCKDELITPLQYRQAADAAMATAKTDEERDAAEKLLEIAEVYRMYEEALQKDDAIDFGDLVRLALELVKNNAEVQQYLAGFKHVLVDEYQDVNSASGALLQALCNKNPNVWVVADQRQSIYRFRGAEPSNVSNFQKAFVGEKIALARNYRSFAPIVRSFERFSAAMGNGRMAGAWEAIRANGGKIGLTVAPSVAAEGEAIHREIEELRKKGVPYSKQVILARSHLTLARITAVLEELGVPLLYLGDLFERKEIRDLLSLVGIGAERGSVGVVRVAALPEYGVPREDSLRLLHWAREKQLSLWDAMSRLPEIEGLTTQGINGLALLGKHLEGLSNASPWTMLTAWLFERSDYLKPLLQANTAASRQQLVAIYQLLKVCGEYMALGDARRKQFLARIRRIEALNQDTIYRAISSEATELDAVRVMTIHGSKGLEFTAVHLPALATRYMPSNRQAVRIPPPPSLSHLVMEPSDHTIEEECLFFVALSRARDYLSLSRAEKYTSQKSGESKFLQTLSGIIPQKQYAGSGRSYSRPNPLQRPPVKNGYSERELELYMKCPARYRYEIIEGLRGGGGDSAYVQFHHCVYKTVGWLEDEQRKGNTVSAEVALGQLDSVWKETGPVKHPLEKYYRAAAEKLVKGMADTVAGERGNYDRQEWAVPVDSHDVMIAPDRVLICADGTVRVQRIRTGKQTKSESGKAIYALLQRGAEGQYPGKPTSIETFYLANGEVVQVKPEDPEKLLTQYSEAISAIESGDFHAEPNARHCPSCPCYFMCGG